MVFHTFAEPSEFLLYALTETGEVGMLDADSGSVSRVRTLIGTSTRPVAVTYDPLKQVCTYIRLGLTSFLEK